MKRSECACLALVLTALALPVLAETSPSAAMLEYRIFEATPIPENAGTTVSTTGLFDTFELDRALTILESRSPRSPAAEVELPGLGSYSAARILSFPRVMVRENESASIASDISGIGSSAGPSEGRESTVRIDGKWAWEEEGLATIETVAEVLGLRGRATVRLRAGETAYLVLPRDETQVVVSVTATFMSTDG